MRKCKNCDEKFSGRSDKKFCTSHCRNTYNNKILSEQEMLMKQTNSIIRKNRKILKTSSPQGKTTIRKEYLDLQGFDFRHFTGVYKTKSGSIYRLCYDYGYTPVDSTKILIINVQNYMSQNANELIELK